VSVILTHNVTVPVSSAAQTFTITITAIPLGAITPTTASVPENTTPVGTVATSGGMAPYAFTLASTGATCTPAASADNGLFTLVSGTGVLTFTAAPNFEAPAPAPHTTGNTYNVCVRATDSTSGTALTADQAIVVTVTNVNEMPSFTKGANVSVAENSVAYAPTAAWATAILNGDEPAVQTLTFNVTVPVPSQALLFSVQPAIDSTGHLTFTPAANISGVATVSVTLSDNGTPPLTTLAQTFTITLTAVNQPPTFTVPATVTAPCYATSKVTGFATAITSGLGDPTQMLTFTIIPASTTIVSSATMTDTGDLTINMASGACALLTANPTPVVLAATLTDNGTTNGAADPKSVSHNFTVNVVPVWTISGTITPPAGFGLLAGGTTVSFVSGGVNYNGTVTNLVTGAYSIAGIPDGTSSGVITPAHDGGGYTFNPLSITISSAINANLTGQNFTATGSRTISGTITGPNGARLPAGTVVNFGGGLIATLNANTPAFTITNLPPKNFILHRLPAPRLERWRWFSTSTSCKLRRTSCSTCRPPRPRVPRTS
jgi:hypothetical protein